MNKAFKMKTILCIGIVLLLSFGLSSYKEDKPKLKNVEKIYIENSCTSFFYSYDNYPTNTHGSCGYVSALILLDYYSLCEEELIDSKYRLDKGLKHMDFDTIKSYNNTDYYSYLNDNKEEYIQAYLITLINEKYGLYNPNSNLPCTLYHGGSSRIKEYYSELHAVIDTYLEEKSITSLVCNRIKEDTRNKTIELIKAGIPVIMAVNYKNKDGHIMISYDYDEVEDELYGTVGIIDHLNHIKISSRYTNFYSALYLEKQN